MTSRNAIKSTALGVCFALATSCTSQDNPEPDPGNHAGSGGLASAASGGSGAAASSGGSSGGAAGTGGKGSGSGGRDGSGGGSGGAGSGNDAGATHDAAPTDAGSDAPALCSGCASEVRDPSDTTMRVHHVHLNVKSARESIAFYEKFFGAKTVWLNDTAEALWAEPLLFLLNEGDFTFSDELQVGFEHVGIGVPDVVAWFDMASAAGVLVDPRNGAAEVPIVFPLTPGSTPFVDPEVDNFSFVYVRGPNSERIEVWSGLAKFRHAHFMTPDVDQTVAWYAALLGVQPLQPMAEPITLVPTNGISIDDVQLHFLAPVAEQAYNKTDGQPIDHIAFSVQDLDAMFARAQQLKVTIVSEPAETTLGFRSFFVRAPQEALLEFVEAGPVSVP